MTVMILQHTKVIKIDTSTEEEEEGGDEEEENDEEEEDGNCSYCGQPC